MSDLLKQRSELSFPAADELSTSPLVGRLAAVAAHDLRNPLAGISSGLQVLQEKLADRPDEAEWCGMLLEEVNKLRMGIQDLVDFAALPAETPPSCDLLPLLKDCLLKVDESFKRCGALPELKTEMEKAPVSLDEGEMRQVLLTLLRYLGLTAPCASKVWVSINAMGDRVRCVLSQTEQDAINQWDGKDREFFHGGRFPGIWMGIKLCQSILNFHRVRFEAAKDDHGMIRFILIFSTPTRGPKGA